MQIQYPCLPDSINKALYLDPKLGVVLVFQDKNTAQWGFRVYDDSMYSKTTLTQIIFQNYYNAFAYNFAILNKLGSVCYSNCDLKPTIDDCGIINIDNKLFIKPIDNSKTPLYIGDFTIDSVNNKINYMVKNKLIDKPKNFKNNKLQNNNEELTQ